MIFIKILVVDDEYLIRNVIKEYCQSEGYKVDEASNGEEAIDKVYENEYDLIIMDIMMPDMDGYEASKEKHERFLSEQAYMKQKWGKILEEDKFFSKNNF